MLAASPTAHQPWGANGVQLSPACDGSAIADRGRDDDDEHRGQPELEARRDAEAERIRGKDDAEHQERRRPTATLVPEPVRSAT